MINKQYVHYIYRAEIKRFNGRKTDNDQNELVKKYQEF